MKSSDLAESSTAETDREVLHEGEPRVKKMRRGVLNEDSDSTNGKLLSELSLDELSDRILQSGSGNELCREKGSSISTCLSHGSISMIGRRRAMEDTVTVAPEMAAQAFKFFAVYDGHGGYEVAKACRDRFHKLLDKEMQESKSFLQQMSDGRIDWEGVMKACFAKMDDEVQMQDEGKKFDDGTSALSVGSTAVVVLVGKEEVVVANCGDSRAVIFRGGVAVPLSNDHKPDRPDERERIEAAGGRVINWNGYRVLGVLAMSRSIGDHHLKPYVISEPEVTVSTRTDSDEFLIIATDGLWDVVSNELACQVLKKCFDRQSKKRCADKGSATESAVAMLASLAIAKGSKDNISIIVVKLNNHGSDFS